MISSAGFSEQGNEPPHAGGESQSGSGGETTPEVTAKAIEWGEAVEGLRVGLGVDGDAYGDEDDPEFRFMLQKTGDERIACVLPSSNPKSEFPQLLIFNVTVKTSDGQVRSVDAYVKSKGQTSMNPGSKEYAEAKKGEIHAGLLKFSRLVYNDKPVELVPGEYEVTVTYFIRASTPKYGPPIPGVTKWAGHHLKTNEVKFIVKQSSTETSEE